MEAVEQCQMDKSRTTGVYLVVCGGAYFLSSTGSETVDVEAKVFGTINAPQAVQWLVGRFRLQQ